MPLLIYVRVLAMWIMRRDCLAGWLVGWLACWSPSYGTKKAVQMQVGGRKLPSKVLIDALSGALGRCGEESSLLRGLKKQCLLNSGDEKAVNL